MGRPMLTLANVSLDSDATDAGIPGIAVRQPQARPPARCVFGATPPQTDERGTGCGAGGDTCIACKERARAESHQAVYRRGTPGACDADLGRDCGLVQHQIAQ